MNPILKDLGYSEDDRVIIFHADDIGMCQSTLTAYTDLLDFGLLSSAAVMVPCPWFASVAELCRQRDDIDIGVHLTITSEWDNYRWGPLSTSDSSTGLIDDEGYFYRGTAPVRENAKPDAVRAEIIAQTDRAKQASIDFTHVDSHMGALFHEKFIPAYYEVGQSHQVPMFFPRLNPDKWPNHNMTDEGIRMAQETVATMEQENIAVFDHVRVMGLDEVWEDGVAQVIEQLEGLKAGLTYFIIHPASDTPELRAIAHDWRARVRDYQTFKSPALREYVQNAEFHVIGYRPLRDRMKA